MTSRVGTRVVAHRGAGAALPENTLVGFEHTVLGGLADGVEFDVQRTADGALVVLHDETLDRTTDVAEVFPGRRADRVETFTSGELAALDCGGWYEPNPQVGERIPNLVEVLDLCAGAVDVLLELKRPAAFPGIEQDVLDALDAIPRARERVTVTSFDLTALARIRALRTDIRLCASVRTSAGWHLDDVVGLGRDVSLAPSWDRRDLSLARDAGLSVTVGALNSPRRLRRALDEGIGSIVTDFPAQACALRDGRTGDESPLAIHRISCERRGAPIRVAVVNGGEADVDLAGWRVAVGGVAIPLSVDHDRLGGGQILSVMVPAARLDNATFHSVALWSPSRTVAGFEEFSLPAVPGNA